MDFNRFLLKRHKKKREGGVISHLQGSERIKSVFQKSLEEKLSTNAPTVRHYLFYLPKLSDSFERNL